MHVFNESLLKTAMKLRGRLSTGPRPTPRFFDGLSLAPFHQNAQAAVCVSADFELAWAWRNLTPGQRDEKASAARRNIPYILQLLDERRMPITWATVGHLFLERCRPGADGRPHTAMPRPQNHRSGDWYGDDPCTDFKKHPAWYAPDLIRKILDSRVRHEVGTHSFSHIDFSAGVSDPELVEAEIRECRKAAEAFGVTIRSLVYPFNHMGHQYLPLLAKLGVTSVRHRDQGVCISYPVRDPSGVFRLYETMNLRRAKLYDYPTKAKIFLERACQCNGLYHLWFHPSDPLEVFRNEFRKILDLVAENREEGRVWVATMGELAAYCEAREQTALQVRRSRNEIEIQVRTQFDRARYGNTQLTLVLPEVGPKEQVAVDRERGAPEKQPLPFKAAPGGLVITMPAENQTVRVALGEGRKPTSARPDVVAT